MKWISIYTLKPRKKRGSRTEGKVQGLGREVTDNVGSVATPERDQAVIRIGATEAVHNTLVRARETTLLDHLILVLDEELDTLDGGSGRLRNSLQTPAPKSTLATATWNTR